MARSPVRDLMTEAVGGDLDGTLRELRAEGLSYEQVADHLFRRHRVEVSGQTIHNWLTLTEPTS